MTISTTPAYPVAGEKCTIASTLTGAYRLAVAITSVPVGSKTKLGLLLEASASPPTSAVEAVRGKLELSHFTPDLPGPYGITAYVVRIRESLPSFLNDALGERRVDFIAKESTTIHVGGLIDLPIATIRGDGAVLRLLVNNSTVSSAALVEPLNEKSRVAAEQATVTSTLGALVGQSINAIGPNVETALTELRAKYEAHRVNWIGGGGVAHTVRDDINVVPRTDVHSVEGAIGLCSLLYDALVQHMTTGSSQTASWHKDSLGAVRDDLKNLPLVDKPGSLAQLTVAQADLRYRVYDRHRRQATSGTGFLTPPEPHRTVDSTNTIAAATLLDSAIVAYLDALALEDPTAPSGESEGMNDAAHLYGFDYASRTETASGGAIVVNVNNLPAASTDELYNCDASIAIGDCVYVSSANTAAKAKADSIATTPAKGIVISKPDAVHCLVRPLGEIDAVFAGLAPGASYCVSATTAGQITTTVPSSANHVVQKVGTAKDADTFVAAFTPNITIL